MLTPERFLTVLLVEDDPGDALLIEEVFSEHGASEGLYIVGDGVEAIDFVRRQGEFADAPRPDLILLDLNLPRRSGREVLAELKADADLGMIPVVVMTTSSAEEDVVRAYFDHANAYVTKPLDWADFTRTVRRVDHFYRDIARLPAQRTA